MKPALLLLTLLFAGPRPVPAKMSDVLKTPVDFDGKSIAVKGTISDFRSKTSQAGNDYTAFDLLDGKQKLSVFIANKLDPMPKDGDKVTVTGRFSSDSKVGGSLFKNEIDASVKIDKRFGVKKQ